MDDWLLLQDDVIYALEKKTSPFAAEPPQSIFVLDPLQLIAAAAHSVSHRSFPVSLSFLCLVPSQTHSFKLKQIMGEVGLV